jgi:positive regulator of sigma E activity
VGTLSLIFGIIFILGALYFLWTGTILSSEIEFYFHINIALGIILLVIGSGLVKMYDKEKKKEKALE